MQAPEHPWIEAEQHLSSVSPAWADHIAATGPCQLIASNERQPWQALMRAVAFQQLHTKAGETIFGRFLALFGGAYPDPAQVLALEPQQLRAVGFSERKAATIQGLAAAASEGRLADLHTAQTMDDAALIAQMAALKGIGRWTVEMFLMFHLQRPDVWPVDDFGVRDGYKRLHALDDMPSPKALTQLGEPLRPWRSVAAWYLWRVPR